MISSSSNIFISGDLEGLSCTEEDISSLIQLLIDTEPSLESLFFKKSVNIRFISKPEIKELNFRFLNKDKPTNVLSFPPQESTLDDELLGDIAICPEIIKSEANDQNKEKQSHLFHIILHSLLHLTGHDHSDDSSAEIMENIEVEALKKIGIANPY